MLISFHSAAKLILIGMVLGFTTAVRADAPAGHIFYAAAPGQFVDKSQQPLLIREVARQAVLMAARDGMGLDTRDEVMNEWDSTGAVPADSAGPPLRIEMDWSTIAVSTIGNGGALVDQIKLPALYKDKQPWIEIRPFVEESEQASEGSALKLLQKAGYTLKPNSSGTGDLPPLIDDLLYQTTLMAPLSALQQTHTLIRQSGESPARLGGLARGYANLGALTRFQWSSIHKVMTARSFLYAQKMVSHNPKSPLAMYHRAYVFALAGYHQQALDDLKTAGDLQDQLKKSGTAPEALPPWVELIEPLCKYDITTLQALVNADAHRSPLAALCCFMDIANCGSYSRLMGIGGEMLNANPACFAILDGMTAHAGIASAHSLTETPLAIMLQTLPRDIKLLPTVPAAVQAAIKAAGQSDDHIRNLANVSAAFIDATEDAEPSYTLAGRIVQETNFVHVQRRVTFMADHWNVDCSDFVKQSLPLITGHRFAYFIQSMVHPAAVRPKVMGPLEVADPQYQMTPMIYLLYFLGNKDGKMTGEAAYHRMYSDADFNAYDQEPILRPYNRDSMTDYELTQARYCRVFCPYSGAPLVIMLKQDWKGTQANADEWVKQFHDQPAVLEGIAVNLAGDNQPDKAEPILKKCVTLDPDRETFEDLANIYLSKGDEAKWESTLKQSLNQPDFGLDHAMVDKEIARHYLDEGKYDKARPFADASANESGAQWAMLIAAEADEHCGDYAAAENQMQAASERYGGTDRFFWCKRTGKGNLPAATAQVNDWVGQQIRERNTGAYADIGTVYYLQSDAQNARHYLEDAMKDSKQPWDGLMAATVCLQQKDSAGRTADLKFVVDNCAGDAQHAAFIDFAKMELAAGDQCPDLAALTKLMATANRSDDTDMMYFFSCIEEQNGKAENAKGNYKQLLTLGDSARWSFVLVCDRLHQLGINETPLPRVEAKPN